MAGGVCAVQDEYGGLCTERHCNGTSRTQMPESVAGRMADQRLRTMVFLMAKQGKYFYQTPTRQCGNLRVGTGLAIAVGISQTGTSSRIIRGLPKARPTYARFGRFPLKEEAIVTSPVFLTSFPVGVFWRAPAKGASAGSVVATGRGLWRNYKSPMTSGIKRNMTERNTGMPKGTWD